MKRPGLFICSLLAALLLCFVAHARAQTIPQRANSSTAVGTAGAAVTCGPAVPSGSAAVLLNHLTGFTVMCGKASGTTAEAVVTITGTLEMMTFYLDELQTAPTFVAEDFTYPVVAPSHAAITISMPAVTSGGPCSCVALYAQF